MAAIWNRQRLAAKAASRTVRKLLPGKMPFYRNGSSGGMTGPTEPTAWEFGSCGEQGSGSLESVHVASAAAGRKHTS